MSYIDVAWKYGCMSREDYLITFDLNELEEYSKFIVNDATEHLHEQIRELEEKLNVQSVA